MPQNLKDTWCTKQDYSIVLHFNTGQRKCCNVWPGRYGLGPYTDERVHFCFARNSRCLDCFIVLVWTKSFSENGVVCSTESSVVYTSSLSVWTESQPIYIKLFVFSLNNLVWVHLLEFILLLSFEKVSETRFTFLYIFKQLVLWVLWGLSLQQRIFR